jgi:hypothetical protein
MCWLTAAETCSAWCCGQQTDFLRCISSNQHCIQSLCASVKESTHGELHSSSHGLAGDPATESIAKPWQLQSLSLSIQPIQVPKRTLQFHSGRISSQSANTQHTELRRSEPEGPFNHTTQALVLLLPLEHCHSATTTPVNNTTTYPNRKPS